MAIFDDDPRRDRPQPPSALRVATGRADGFVAPPLRYQASPRRRFAPSTPRARHKRYRRLKTLCIVLDGKTPYLDFYETKPPGIFYCYAFITSLFGPTLEGSHLGFMVLNLLSVLFIFRSAALIFKERIGLVVATAFAFSSMNPYLSDFTTQSEHIVTLFVSSGLFVLLKGLQRESMPYYFFSGILFCAAMLVKQNGAFFALFGGLAVISHHLLGENRNWKKDFGSG